MRSGPKWGWEGRQWIDGPERLGRGRGPLHPPLSLARADGRLDVVGHVSFGGFRCRGTWLRLCGPLLGLRWARCFRTHVSDLVGKLMNEHSVAERGLADVGAGTAVHGEAIAFLPNDLDGALGGTGLLGDQRREAGGVRGSDGDAGA